MKGTCHCGAIEVEVPDDAFGVVACHCGDCQKLHGNFFAMLAVDRSALAIKDEGSKLVVYTSSAKAKRSFCGTCGSRIAKDPNGSPKVLVSIGLFDRATPRKIEKHVFVESKPSWYEVE